MSQTTTDIDAVADALRVGERFLVTSHENPDGDALGSLLAMHLALVELGKDSVMVLAGGAPLPAEYSFLDLGAHGLLRDVPDDAGERILAFTVCPGFTVTGMVEEYVASRGGGAFLADIPLGRPASVEEVAETVRWLAVAAPASATGAAIDVNGASFVR